MRSLTLVFVSLLFTNLLYGHSENTSPGDICDGTQVNKPTVKTCVLYYKPWWNVGLPPVRYDNYSLRIYNPTTKKCSNLVDLGESRLELKEAEDIVTREYVNKYKCDEIVLGNDNDHGTIEGFPHLPTPF